MHTRHCLKLAARISALLQHELGQGTEPARMLAEPLYRRDVLLVCDALRGSELAELAAHFRRAIVTGGVDGGAPGRPGFSASRFLSSIFGAAPTLDEPAPAPSQRSRFARERSIEK